ncbi:MAG TPA: tRNA-dihydrouridine synthase family protein [Vicinamibacterales bacterium]|nr:tRNA-dihydrouridine synthase family protein [Vicinamibacterales bacterium]
MSLRDLLAGAIVMAPMTKGSNLPYRRLCVELGARVVMSEMVVARRLKQRRQSEFALIRRAPGEPCFGVQLAGNKPDEMAWAAALVESRGADFIDVNLGCPIDHFTRMGLGAALARQPGRVARIVAAMRATVTIPVTVKIRLGWNKDSLNYLELAKAAVDAGAAAVTVHGRTREARYRHPADWDRIAEIAAALPVPVIGNGDVLFAHEARERLQTSGCAAVMAARGVLITPWLFREWARGYEDLSAEHRVALYRRYVALALEHWGDDEHGRTRLREFLRWHLGFWCRYAPRREDGSWPSMQQREGSWEPRSPLESWLARTDAAALDAITDQLLRHEELSAPPAPAGEGEQTELVEAG